MMNVVPRCDVSRWVTGESAVIRTPTHSNVPQNSKSNSAKKQRSSKNTENLRNLFVVGGDLRGNSTPSQAVSLPYQSHLQADRQPCLFVCLVLCCICLLHFCHPSTLYQQCHLSLLCKLTANPKPMSSVYPTPPKMQHNQSMVDRLLFFGIEIFI